MFASRSRGLTQAFPAAPAPPRPSPLPSSSSRRTWGPTGGLPFHLLFLPGGSTCFIFQPRRWLTGSLSGLALLSTRGSVSLLADKAGKTEIPLCLHPRPNPPKANRKELGSCSEFWLQKHGIYWASCCSHQYAWSTSNNHISDNVFTQVTTF